MHRVFDLSETRQEFQGFGVHTWAAMEWGNAELEALGVRYIRITRDGAPWDAMRALRAETDRLGIEWLYNLWSAPRDVVGRDRCLSDVQGFADHWLRVVTELDAEGVRPHYIDLMNEPDSGGGWSTGIWPKQYCELVKAVRARLDGAGFADVGIVGPGLTHLNWQDGNTKWFAALDAEAADALVAFSTHSWDDGDLGHGGASVLEERWPTFGDPADALDPGKPKWLTEYATKETTFHGITYPHADETGGFATAHSMAYAVRVFENTLAHLNMGANTLFYWCAQDAGKSWGYVDAKGAKKPIYSSLMALYPKIPVGARVVAPPEQSDDGPYTAVLIADDRVILGAANDTLEAHSLRVELKGAPDGLQIEEAVACVLDSAGDPAIEIGDAAKLVDADVKLAAEPGGRCSLTADMPPDSTLTVILAQP